MTLSIQTHEVGLCVGLETNKKKKKFPPRSCPG